MEKEEARVTEVELRHTFGQLLKGQAEFLKIRENSKAPVGSFRPGKRNRYKRIPKTGNFGILPQGPLFVLDVDTHKGGAIADQVVLFSKLLGLDLTTTLVVATPSGGRHFYLRLPASIESAAHLPKTNLRSLEQEIQSLTGLGTRVDADIRSEAANAYVVGPGSAIKAGAYSIIAFQPIQEISEVGYANLVALKVNRAKREPAKPDSVDLWADEPLAPEAPGPATEVTTAAPPTRSIERLDRALRKKNYSTYHQQRAFVKAALHCCYSNEAIALACVALGINRDSSSGNSINRYALQKDIASFVPGEKFHGPYCPNGMAKATETRTTVLTEAALAGHLKTLEAQRTRRAATPAALMFKRVDPRVLDVDKISKALLAGSKRGVKAKQYRAAMLIVEGFLQPLANAGAEKILLAQGFLTEELPLTQSQVAQGLRVLRAAGIIELRDRQKQGFAPTYVIHPQFVHKKLTFHLKRTWVARREEGLTEPLVYAPRLGGFFTALSGEQAFTNSLAALIAKAQAETLQAYWPEPVETRALTTYLRSQREQ